MSTNTPSIPPSFNGRAPAPIPAEGWWLPLCCLLSATGLGLALHINNGMLLHSAMVVLSLTLALITVGVVAWQRGRWTPRAEALLTALMGAALLFQLLLLSRAEPGIYLRLSGSMPYPALMWGLALQAALVAGLLVGPTRLWRVFLPGLLAVHIFVGAWMLQASPAPIIDVFIFQTEGPDALLDGQNPYAMTFENIYGDGIYYGDELVEDGRLQFGFPYPPLSLYFSTLARIVGGDPRWAQLVAITVAAGLMATARGGRLGMGAAALLLLTPRGLFVLEQAWTEPLLIVLLSATVFCACRFPQALPYAFGLLLAVKQYTIFLVPLIILLTPLRGRALWGLLWRAGITALVISVPLILLDLPAFLHSVVTLQVYQPFRPDALSYLAWWGALTDSAQPPPVWIAFAAVAGALALALWRAPRSPAGFALAVAFVYGVFFAFNKQAFANYYYFVLGALCVALAACRTPQSAPDALPRPRTRA